MCSGLQKAQLFTYLHTGHLHVPLSQLSCRYDSRSKHCGEKHHNSLEQSSPTHRDEWRNLPATMKLNSLFKVEQTWTCLQSCPRAGSWMRRKVMGHFSDTLMAVCSTPSSPFRVVLPAEAATLLKFLLTKMRKHFRTVTGKDIFQSEP